jgi:hypothetical protein
LSYHRDSDGRGRCDRALAALPSREVLQEAREGREPAFLAQPIHGGRLAADVTGREAAPTPVEPACWSRIVARAGQVVCVAERGLILTQPQQTCRSSRRSERLAHAQGSKPGRIRADDPVEREQRRTCRKGRLARVEISFPLGSGPTW